MLIWQIMAVVTESRKRLKKLLKKAALFCGIGLGYAFFAMLTHVAIPCPIHAITGFYCPGCGVSRMCLSLLQLDVAEAFRWNPGVMIAAPFMGIVFLRQGVRYVQTGQMKMNRWQNVVLWCILIWLIVFTILRNLPAFSFLAPGGTVI